MPYYRHFSDEEMETQKMNDVLRITWSGQYVCSTASTGTQFPWVSEPSYRRTLQSKASFVLMLDMHAHLGFSVSETTSAPSSPGPHLLPLWCSSPLKVVALPPLQGKPQASLMLLVLLPTSTMSANAAVRLLSTHPENHHFPLLP